MGCSPWDRGHKERKVGHKIRELGGLQLIGSFTVLDLHKIDVPLFWKKLARVTGLGSRWSGYGWR
eukprot:1141015-Pelagomonas_calceolata.AAC.3